MEKEKTQPDEKPVQMETGQFMSWLAKQNGIDIVDFPRERFAEPDQLSPHCATVENPIDQIRAIRTNSPFNKLEIRIDGVRSYGEKLEWKTAKQRVTIDQITIDRNDWSRVQKRRLFNGRMDLSFEFGALVDLFNLLSR